MFKGEGGLLKKKLSGVKFPEVRDIGQSETSHENPHADRGWMNR
jgi:hypothetical protein